MIDGRIDTTPSNTTHLAEKNLSGDENLQCLILQYVKYMIAIRLEHQIPRSPQSLTVGVEKRLETAQGASQRLATHLMQSTNSQRRFRSCAARLDQCY